MKNKQAANNECKFLPALELKKNGQQIKFAALFRHK